MKRILWSVLIASLAAVSGNTWAAESAAENIHKLDLPKLAPSTATGPEAKLKVPKGSQIEEYKVNGRVYMIKVIPPKPFPPYYLVDKSGSGEFTQVPQKDINDLSVPHWVIFRW
ncbi:MULTISPECIES: DUF2782 domain-containing protein [Acidithiobacillus]|jgi:hypothetical protein|uniref:DUF2782 domain-containing protein n=2 Tax=Acidithiobacillus caldus TaxID=33059 RepID=A0A1E7YK07_9PROT|nr:MULTISPECIES: DUF2782 domain-containing protein [Acidithiobacillus]AEK59357.1 conserved hypothetical secreted protein [Acidithiobacillus caldus SM-1]AUW33735.1 DUF2782 domain-containing protein [Acidithiobacillus caldus]MBU2744390.1 DUF2782 domain-containing protein [Acidithiobacillus caldus]MBU2763929.1 DUF2782 domain-containing protein [Acidithiobacillus caldus]MBU2771054.1 DUF2782 domain-containing protein [Acidithiobacillus caldus]